MNWKHITLTVATVLLVTTQAALSLAQDSTNEEEETDYTVVTTQDDETTANTAPVEGLTKTDGSPAHPAVGLLYGFGDEEEEPKAGDDSAPPKDDDESHGGSGGGGGGGGSSGGSGDDTPPPENESDEKSPPAPQCLQQDTVAALTSCLIERIPREIHWTGPTDTERDAWKKHVTDLLGGSCPHEAKAILDGKYMAAPFEDDDGSNHCVLLESDDAKTGWGSLIVRQSPARSFDVHIPYPLFATDTWKQGLDLYLQSEPRSLLLAGAHRNADETHGCQDRSVTETTRGCRSLFQATTEAILDHATQHQEDLTVIQFHAMARSSCPDTQIQLSDGTDKTPSDDSKVQRLQAALQKAHPEWDITHTGEGTCTLDGQTNTQGRLLNGIPPDDVADTFATGASGHFLHIIQDPGHRDGGDWTAALSEVFPFNGEGDDEQIGEPIDEPPECLSGARVTDVLSCIAGRMPREIEWVHPEEDDLQEWRLAVLAALTGDCPNEARAILNSRWITAPHTGDDGASHCVLLEADDSALGWGSLIVREGPARNIALQVSHPLYDVGTWQQSVDLYDELQAHSILLAGTHRHADESPGCRDRAVTDMSHSCNTLYQSAVEVLLNHMEGTGVDITALQFHGMAASTCGDTQVHISPGIADTPAEETNARRLQSALATTQPDWTVTVPGEGDCNMNATTNVQGRLLNGVPASEVAKTFAEDASGRFLHIEQDPDQRSGADWTQAIRDVWS